MTSLEITLPDEVAETVKAKAEAAGKSVSEYLADLVVAKANGWPERFFEEVVGGWKGEPLERAPQGEFEKRDDWP